MSIASIPFKHTNKWTWTNESNTSTSSATTYTTSLNIEGPSYDYKDGIQELLVYQDTVYNTYAFILVPISSLAQPAVTGIIKNTSGQPMPNAEVVLTQNGTQFHTVSNSQGKYTIFSNISTPATVEA